MDLDGLKQVAGRHSQSGDHPHRGHRNARSRRRFRTKSSTPIRTPIWTMRRSRNAGPAPCRCAARLPDLADGMGALDAAAIEQVAAESWPVVRDADELHDALLTLDHAAAGRGVAALVRRAGGSKPRHRHSRRRRNPLGRGRARRHGECRALWRWRRATGCRHRDPARLARIHRTGDGAGPRRTAGLAPRSGGGRAWRAWKPKDRFCAGRFSPESTSDDVEWCQPPRAGAHPPPDHRPPAPRNRAGLDRRFHPLPGSLAASRARQRSCTVWMARCTIVRQLQGYEISAAAWESQILPRRIARYSPDLLDQLCLSGEVTWGRLVTASGVRSRGPWAGCVPRA